MTLHPSYLALGRDPSGRSRVRYFTASGREVPATRGEREFFGAPYRRVVAVIL